MEMLTNEARRKYSVPMNPKFYASQFFEGYLEKKGRNIFAGWQKRYFRCLEGKILIYTESKESKLIKGFVQIKKIAYIKSLDTKSFIFETGDREYTLKAETEALKKKWIEVLEYLMEFLNQKLPTEMDSTLDVNKTVDVDVLKKMDKNDDKEEQMKKISKKTADLIKKYGYIINKDDGFSKQLLEVNDISKLINIDDPKVIMRMHYGFMYKKQKSHDIYNKRWFFIFSPRPLFNDYILKEENDLEQKKQKDWLKFNVLYYFKYDRDKQDAESGQNYYDNEIEMVNCHKIVNYEKEGKYFMNLDGGDRTYVLYCESRSERDEWFEVLINSRKTAKEYKLSITKHPRNIELLNYLFLKNGKEFIKKMQEEEKAIVGNLNDLSEFNVFEFTINNFQSHIESTLDGCLCSNPSKLDLLKAFGEFMNKEYLDIFRIYWENNYDKLSNEEILKMSYILLNFYDKCYSLNIDDVNLSKNGKVLSKIYFKKIFENILSTIENILKNERECKGNKNEEGIYYTLGPKDLFDLLSKTLDLIKENKHPIIYKELLKIFNIAIFQYAIGVNCVISNQDIILESEYLISVSNNSLNMIGLLNSLIDSIKETGVLTEKEINESIQFKKIYNSINKLSFGAIVRLVYMHKDEFEKSFEKINYFDIEIEKIIGKSVEIYGKYKSMMNVAIIKKYWNEIMKLTLCYYITSLLLTARKKMKKKEDVQLKIKNDKKILSDAYTCIVGENLVNSTLKILDDINDFLEVSQCMISSTCLAIRQYIGPAFAYSAAKKFIKLRTDLSNEEKNDCKKQCEDVLNNYNGPKNEDSSYFIILFQKIKKNDKDKILKKSLKIKFGKTIIEKDDEDKESSDSDIEEDKNITDKLQDFVKYSDINDFLKDYEEENDYEEDIYENKEEVEETQEEEEENLIYLDDDEDEGEIKDEFEENIKIDHEGFFYKKTYNTYRKYYFQVKNGCLYWFIDKNANMAKNKISLKSIDKIDSSEEKKFILKIKEKEESNEYKFKCDSEEEKIAWVKAINRAMKKVKNEDNKEIEVKKKVEIKLRKKVINDLFNLPNIKNDGVYIETSVMGSLADEDFFKMTPLKIERIKKEKELERMEELEKMKKKENKKDKKEKKSFTKKIKGWFKSKKKKNKE